MRASWSRPLAVALGIGVLAGAGTVALAAAAAAAQPPPIVRAKPLASLTLGFSGGADPVLASGNPATQAFWVPRAHSEDAQMVRLDVSWSAVAPQTLPPGFDASNPAAPGYNWTTVDAQVRELATAHFQIMITVQGAPTWAEGPGMPSSAFGGTWKPSAADLAQFAQAIATRYDGSYPDPLRPGHTLPRVAIWQAWDEPNLPELLSPQWQRTPSGRLEPVSPRIYRGMENAFYHAVKRVSASNYVVMAGLAPYGDSPGLAPTDRMRPVEFERALLCVTTKLALQRGCGGATYFDAIDSHPYSIYGPTWHAYWADDVSIPDVHKLVRVLRAAQKLHTAMPAGPKGNWVTETSWNTKPPNPRGVPVAEDARWLEQALYILWQQGVSHVLWWQLSDSPPDPTYYTSYESGTFYLDGRPKPAATAFRFPFITWRTGPGTVMIWARAPGTGVVSVQALDAGRWQTLVRVRVRANQVFELPLALTGAHQVRAKLGADTSLPWAQAA
ncbi:MAG: hypothetical protein M0T77_12840 [Actinomycetota bacterium]|nr:hypothetical protein [Actinomycetota bacterium]